MMQVLQVIGVSVILFISWGASRFMQLYNDISKRHTNIIQSQYSAKIIGLKYLPDNDRDTIKLADTFMNELNKIISSPQNIWYNESYDIKLLNFKPFIQSIKVSGDFEAYNIPITRASFIVKNCNANKLFKFLVSPKGFSIIDPVSNPLT